MIRHTGTACAPSYLMPADHKAFTRLAVAEVATQALDGLGPAFDVDGAEGARPPSQGRWPICLPSRIAALDRPAYL